ncbi:hypothetical protein L6452_38587 [Arctium lappa]|uniref:Uncharacterized protein n=1 Tax=Arctium lappa TaxID=4217 RepID=A0ACB8XU32_ARCLA|nr:hypothetical protein L6452_38587 [Arctium lappa]
MGQSKKLKNLHSILKDKAKIIKATFSITNRTTTSIQIAVIRATTRSTHSPPPDHRISSLLSVAHTTRHSASACTSAIIHRLHHHHQRNAYVTLKSLITLHSMIAGGSFVLHSFPAAADHRYLNLSRFVDNTDTQSREFSLWAQWYARFLESNLSTSKVLGCSLSSKSEIDKKQESVKYSLFMDLFKEIEALVSMIEEICRAPRSLHCQTNDIIYEVMRLVGEDYRMAQYHTMIRLTELSTRIHSLSTNELSELTWYLERLKGCKERLTELFVNRRRNESFWELVTELMAKLIRLKEDRELKSVSRRMIEYTTESTQLKKQLRAASRPLGLLPLGDGNHWLNVDGVKLTFSMANA